MALKKNHPRRQHCVPQFLLRNFADEKGKFYIFDKVKERSFESKPRAVIAESRFYDFVDGGGQPGSFEYVLSDHEATIAALIESIIERQSIAQLTSMDRLNIAQFAAVLQCRVQGVRQRLKSLHDGIQRVLEERDIDGGDVVPKLSEQAIQHVSLVQMHRSIKNGRVLAKRQWMLQRAPDSTPFYISDNPMVIVNHIAPRELAIEHPGVDIYLPISRQLSLYFVSDMLSTALLAGLLPEASEQTDAMCTGNVDLLTAENVQYQNSLQVQQASRFIVSANGDFHVVREMIKRNPGLKKQPGYIVT